MKLVLDPTLCQGYGLCQQAAPELVDLDDWGYAGLRPEAAEVPAPEHGRAHEAAGACPARALRVLA